MAKWNKFPHDLKAITYAGDALKKNWDTLHKGDGEAFPKEAGLQEAWRQYHAGNFAEAAAAGEGHTVAIKATSIYANYLEKKDSIKLPTLRYPSGDHFSIQRREARSGVWRPDSSTHSCGPRYETFPFVL